MERTWLEGGLVKSIEDILLDDHQVIVLVSLLRATFLMASVDEILHHIWMKRRYDVPEELAWWQLTILGSWHVSTDVLEGSLKGLVDLGQ